MDWFVSVMHICIILANNVYSVLLMKLVNGHKIILANACLCIVF